MSEAIERVEAFLAARKRNNEFGERLWDSYESAPLFAADLRTLLALARQVSDV